jgi:hypothetical protein
MRTFCLMAICGLLIVSSPKLVCAQGPIPGQPYQVPAELAGFTPGTLATYGGYDYVIQGDGTMLLAEQPGFTYTSYYVPPTTTYFVGQPTYNPWVGYRHGWQGQHWGGPHWHGGGWHGGGYYRHGHIR